MKIQLSDHFDYGRLLRFTFPSIVMMIFTSVYSIVDGFFVSNFVGKTSFAAVNFIMPVLLMLGSTGTVLGVGGSALVAKTFGEGDDRKANELFSLFIYITIGLGLIITTVTFFVIEPIAVMMGAEGQMLADCMTYGKILLIAVPFFILQYAFQGFFITAEKPKLGLTVSLISGVTNIVLDVLFMAVFRWGITGAALATAISQTMGGAFALIYFMCPNSSLLRLTGTKWDGKALLKACTNGSSEFMTNISMSLVGMLYNVQLINYAGENGVAAYGVIMYVNMIFLAFFIGYSVGVGPVISYHFGAQNYEELQGLRKKSLMIIASMACAMFAAAELFAAPLSGIFVGYDEQLLEMTTGAFKIYAFSFLFAGFAIFGSSFFTALNDGLTSALISFMRSLVFEVGAVLLLPMILDLNGIWMSVIVAEAAAVLLTVFFMAVKKKKYQY